MAGGFPLIGVAGVMQTGRRDNQGAIGLQVEPWAWVKFPQWAIEGKIMMRPFAARNHHRGSREWTIGMYEVLQGEIATVAGVDIEHAETGALPGENAHIGIGPLHPPLVNLGRIDAGSVGPVRNARVFAGFLALRVATGTIPLCDVVQWDAKFGLVKVNPLLTWTKREVWQFIADHDVPYNPLHDQGYPSIGCWPCTRPVANGEDERAGRWAGTEKKECGLHVMEEGGSGI